MSTPVSPSPRRSVTPPCLLLLAAGLALQSAPAAGRGAAAAPKIPTAWKAIFSDTSTALQTRNETLFRLHFLPKAYTGNLVGGSGLSGQAAYRRGSRKGWILKPQWKRVIRRGPGAVIVPCDIWLWRQQRTVDLVYTLLAKKGKRWLIFGGGEKLPQVEALLARHRAGKPLAPPPKP